MGKQLTQGDHSLRKLRGSVNPFAEIHCIQTIGYDTAVNYPQKGSRCGRVDHPNYAKTYSEAGRISAPSSDQHLIEVDVSDMTSICVT